MSENLINSLSLIEDDIAVSKPTLKSKPKPAPASTPASTPAPAPMPESKPKQCRGFAVMSPEKQLAAARKGGASVSSSKRSFSCNPELAREAGRKGGMSKRTLHEPHPTNSLIVVTKSNE